MDLGEVRGDACGDALVDLREDASGTSWGTMAIGGMDNAIVGEVGALRADLSNDPLA